MIGRVLRAEMRGGLPFWLMPLGLVLAALPVLSAFMGSNWAFVQGLLMRSTVPVLGVLALMVATWKGGRERRRKVGELFGSTPRPRLHRTLGAWLPTVAWPALGYGLSLLVISGVLLTQAGPGRPMPGVLAVAGAELAGCGAIGFALGWFVPSRWVAPVTGVGAVAAMTFLLAPYGSFELLFIAPDGLHPWESSRWWYPAVSTVCFAGLAAAAMLLTGARRRWLVVVPLTGAVLSAALITRTDVWRIDTTSPMLACGTGELPICVSARNAGKLEEVARSTRVVRARLTGLAEAPREVQPPRAELDTLGGRHDSPAAILWPSARCIQAPPALPGECHPSTRQAGKDLAVAATEWDNCPGSREPPVRLRAGVRAWLLDQPGDAREITRRIAAMPEQERTGWLDRYLSAAQYCDYGAVDELRSR